MKQTLLPLLLVLGVLTGCDVGSTGGLGRSGGGGGTTMPPPPPPPPVAKKVAYRAYMVEGQCAPVTNPPPSQEDCRKFVEGQVPAVEQGAFNALHNCILPRCWTGNVFSGGQDCAFGNGARASKCLYCIARYTYGSFADCRQQALDAGLDPFLSNAADITPWLQDPWQPLRTK